MKLIVDGLAINYRREGSGRVVLMLHGWMSDSQTFSQLVQQLSGTYDVIRLDLPGFGDSELPPSSWGLSEYVAFIVAFLEKLKIERLHAIIGHSLGGRIVIKAVGSGQLKADRLVLLGSHGINQSRSMRNRLYWLAAKTGKVVTKPLPAKIKVKLRQRLYRRVGATDYLQAGALQQTFLNIIREDVRPEAAMITAPTLLIYGQDDEVTPPEFGKTFQRLIEGSKLEVISQAGHFVHEDQLPIVAKLVTEFLQ
ncbi:alpha/beta hydrolase [Candidatus Microgenomates bacterium]|nr:alpha/beta hydrolase [Candidatus Microgenomates bacterium]